MSDVQCPSNLVNSSILAGQDIFAYSADTSYTNLLNVQSAMTSTTITQILVRELDPKEPGGFGAIKVIQVTMSGICRRNIFKRSK